MPHTPGPWSKGKIKSLDVMVDSSSPCPMINCIAATNWEKAEEWYANARLIAAAPELLDLVKAWVQLEKDTLDYSTTRAIVEIYNRSKALVEKANATIAKAEGRE